MMRNFSYIFSVLQKRFLYLALFACVFSYADVARSSASVTEQYGDHLQYMNFYDIPFSTVPADPVSIPDSVIQKVQGDTPTNASQEKEFQDWIMAKLDENQIPLKFIQTTDVKDTILILSKIITNSIMYCIDRHGPMIADHILSNLKTGEGVCADYAWMMAKSYRWVQNQNSNLKNAYVIISTEELLDHAWNMLLIFYPEKLIYSHIDLVSSGEGEYGIFREGAMNLHLLNSSSYNLGFLFEMLDEPESSFKYYNTGLAQLQRSDDLVLTKEERIYYYMKLAKFSEITGNYKSSYYFNRELYDMTKDKAYLEKKAYMSFELGEVPLSLYHYAKLFEIETFSPTQRLFFLSRMYRNMDMIGEENFFNKYEKEAEVFLNENSDFEDQLFVEGDTVYLTNIQSDIVNLMIKHASSKEAKTRFEELLTLY